MKDGLQVETKAWRVWAELGDTIQGKRLDALSDQVEKYLLNPSSKLHIEFKGSIFDSVRNTLEALQRDFGGRLTWTHI